MFTTKVPLPVDCSARTFIPSSVVQQPLGRDTREGSENARNISREEPPSQRGRHIACDLCAIVNPKRWEECVTQVKQAA